MIQTTVIPKAARHQETGFGLSNPSSDHKRMQVVSPGGTVKAGLYDDEETGVFSTTLSSSLGLSLPNPAPEIDMGVKNSGLKIILNYLI